MEIPDRKVDIPKGGINVDKLHADRINEKNNNRLRKLDFLEHSYS